MLQPVVLRDLRLEPRCHPRGEPHLSSASGLVRAGRFLHLVADDEHHFGTLDLRAPGAALELMRFRQGDLPADKHERKRLKPDLEALALLPPAPGWPQGALLALGSGSRPQRQQAFLAALHDDGRVASPARALDLSALYAPLREQFRDLNIEGAFVAADRLNLLQRANRGQPRNACLAYDLAKMLAWIAGGAPAAAAPAPLRCTDFQLGAANGIAYGFTDGAAWPGGGWVFAAVAEDTEDSYADGRCAGSAVGWVSAGGELLDLQALEGAPKVEGVAVADGGSLLLVTDADDAATPSRLYELTRASA